MILPPNIPPFACVFGATLVATLLLASRPAVATEVGRCHGIDMLAELQTTSPQLYKKVMEESKALPNTEAVFWKLEKPGTEPSYLFGTMHLSDPRISELPQRAKDAIAQSKSVTLEVADLADQAVGAALTNDRDLFVYGDGSKTLKAQLSDDEYKKV